jgi:hypothetical protein
VTGEPLIDGYHQRGWALGLHRAGREYAGKCPSCGYKIRRRGPEGRRRPQPRHRQPEYAGVLKWRDKATAYKFSAAVIKLLLARHPGALDGEEAP